MDSRSVSYSTPSRRNSSKAYVDLNLCRSYVLSGGSPSNCIMGTFEHRTLKPSKPPHIGIVGAGVAGLRCADILLQHGFRVTILEGRDRVGGRVNQVQIPNTNILIDTGANWIHGTDQNPILDLAKQANTMTHSWGEDINLFDEDGKFVPDEIASEHNEIVWGIVIDAFKHSNKNTASIPARESLYDFFKTKLSNSLPEGDADNEKRKKMVLQMSQMWGAFVGGTIERQSLKFFWLEETIEGENLFCAGTYQKILGLIAKPVLGKAEIRFSTKVVKIDANKQHDEKVATTTEEGERLDFDEVVVTAPLGWLKQNESAFTPSLPARLSSAIRSIGYGCLEKVWITFPRPFWLSSSPDTSSKPETTAPNSSVSQDFKGFTQFLCPKYSTLNPHRWNQELLELGSLPLPTSHPTLLFYIFDDESRAITSALSRLSAQKDRHEYLTTFFRPYYTRIPNYSVSNPDCYPLSSYATEWLNDDLAGNGSYSNFQIGLEEGDKDIETMREGLPDRGLWFAGEHTAPFVALGTTTGAYWSGEGVAKRIAEAYGVAVDGSLSKSIENVGEGRNADSGTEQDTNVRAFANSATDK